MKKKEFKHMKTVQPISVGLVFGFMFWLIFDSIVLGVMLGVIFYLALREYGKR
jgi:hypothetical protein